MTFMDSLRDNPTGSSGIYDSGGGPPVDYAGPLAIFNRVKDREMRDFQNKANFMSDLTLKQNRLQALFNPSATPSQGGQQDTSKINTVMAKDPDTLTGYEKGQLGVRNREADLESQKIKQTGQLGQGALDVKEAQQKLNQEKSDQINASKQADMERKINDSAAKIEMAQKVLESRDANAAAQLQAHKDLAAAMEERHKLELENRQREFDTTSKQHQEQIDALKKQIEDNKNVETTTELNPDGTKKVVTTKKGSASKTVQVKGKDGATYTIPADKLDDWNANHASQ